MSLKDQLTADMKEAMRNKETARLTTIRMLRSAIKNKEIDAGHELDDDAVIGVISTLVKQRRESATTYRENDRIEMAEQEEAEIEMLQVYLPQQLTEDEVVAIVEAAIDETGASSVRDMGAVMKVVMAKTTGRADGKVVNQLVRARLGA